MQGQEHEPAIERLTVEADPLAPRDRPALRRGEILDRMKRKRREIGHLAAHLPLVHRTHRMRRIREHDNPAEDFLQFVRSLKSCCLLSTISNMRS